MKKYIVWILVISFVLSMTACGDTGTDEPITDNTQTTGVQIDSTEASVPESTANDTDSFETEPSDTECSHVNGEWKTDKDATCTADGSKYKECTECGTVMETESVAATGHTEEVIPGKAPTAAETGLTEGTKCAVCGEVLVEQQTIPMIHSETVNVDWNGTDYWSITNVTGRGEYLMGGQLPMRIFYVTGTCTVTLLTNLNDPSQWGYMGSYLGINDECLDVERDYAAIKKHGVFKYYTDEYGDTWKAAGTYYDLPDGTWYFGNVDAGSSFFVVVNNPTAEANGTLE